MSRPSLQQGPPSETKTPLLVENKQPVSIVSGQEQWRPAVLSRRSFLASVALTVCMLLGLAVLQITDKHQGYLTELTSDGRRSHLQNLCVHYLPISLIVMYSLWIDSIDLDCRRLEPFYLLSRKGWTSAKQSLLLRYDVDFAGTIAYQSLRARHWPILCITVTAMLATIVLPSVQNAVPENRQILKTTDTSFYRSRGLETIQGQNFTISDDFLNTAYSVLWMNQEMPRFTARDAAIVPFAPTLGSPARMRSHDLATANTIRYWTEVSCTTPVVMRSNSTDWNNGIMEVDDSQNCRTRIQLPIGSGNTDPTLAKQIFGVYRNLALRGCSEGTFLAAFMHVDGMIPDFTDNLNASALICKSSYWAESVMATVTTTDQIIGPLVATGPKRVVDGSEFNKLRFEYILTTGYVPGLESLAFNESTGFDVASMTRPVQRNRLLRSVIYYDSEEYFDTAVAFALASSGLNASAFLNTSIISRVFPQVHQLLFAFAASDSMIQKLDVSTQGSFSERKMVISIVQGFAGTMQGLLLLVILALVYLSFSYSRRHLHLLRDPDSMTQVVELARNQGVQEVFNNLEHLDEKAFERSVELRDFALHYDSNGVPVLSTSEQDSDHARMLEQEQPISTPRHVVEADWMSIGPVILIVTGLTVVLLILNRWVYDHDGLTPPSHDAFQRQLALDVAPTLFATLLGIYMKMICRTMCFLSPMEDLRAGYATVNTTLLTRYTAILPQLVSWRAFRAKHYLLCALGVVALTSHLLVVSLAGLFEQRYVSVQSRLQAKQLFQPRTTDTAGYAQVDPYYIVVANVSSNTSMPVWATPHYTFIPLELPLSPNSDAVYIANLTGYGADLDCQHLSRNTTNAIYDMYFVAGKNVINSSVNLRFATTHRRTDGSRTTCAYYSPYAHPGNYKPISGIFSQQNSLEIIGDMVNESDSALLEDREFCDRLMIMAWIRAQPTDRLTPINQNISNATKMQVDHQETVVSCEPRVKAARFQVHLHYNGSIVEAKPLDQPTYQLPPGVDFRNSTHALQLLWQGPGSPQVYPQLHNDTFARDWTNYLLKLSSPDATNTYLNASHPPPDPKRAMADLSDSYSRLFVAHTAIRQDSLVRISNSISNTTTTTITTDPRTAPPLVPITIVTTEERLFLSQPMLIISVTLLLIDILAMLAFRLSLSKAFLPRMPFTLAAQIAYFSSSRVVDDVVAANAAERNRNASKNGDGYEDGGADCESVLETYRYGYGRYIGKDGRPHIGIEREPFVVKLGRGTDSMWARVLAKIGVRGKYRF